jgi:hypothetical protein
MLIRLLAEGCNAEQAGTSCVLMFFSDNICVAVTVLYVMCGISDEVMFMTFEDKCF